MQVELREHIGRNIATGKPEKLPHYRVFVDGRAVGYIGWKPGARLLLIERFGPIEFAEISEKVAALIIAATPDAKPGEARQAPDVPPELLQPPELDEIDVDDFD